MEHLKIFSFYTGLLVQIIFIPFHCLGQTPIPFYDDDLNVAPNWQGNIGHFVINEHHQLQLLAPEAGKSYLSTPSLAINDAVWEVYVELDFNPSSNNYARIYLVADNPDLSGPLNGYFVMLGGSEDEISLYKQQGQALTKIIDGEDKRLDFSNVKLKLQVLRSHQGAWQLWSAVGDTTQFVQEGEVVDNDVVSSLFSGVFCTYTATRADKFRLDNFIVLGEAFIDTIPPDLSNIECLSHHTLRLTFSEPLDPSSVGTLADFEISPDIGLPKAAVLEKDDPYSVLLSFQGSFKMGKTYTLSIQHVRDTVGNKIQNRTMPFLFFLEGKAQFREVVINELMANPTPRVGLPEAEYIELLNRGEYAYNLADWRIADDRSQGIIKDYLLLPGDYVILCALADTALFKGYGNTLGVSPWPTLNNEGDNISLINNEHILIDQVNYNTNWYKSAIRSKGGYSLEMIDPLNPCSQEDNWKASMQDDGGTPGRINSVFARKPDLKGPELERVFPQSADTLLLYFNESIDTAAITSAAFFINKKPIRANVGLGVPVTSTIELVLETPLEAGVAYSIEVHKIKDCNGNYIGAESNKRTFGLLESAGTADVIINEVLFNPRVNGVDFVEIYNNSTKYLNLKGWMLANTSIEQEAGLEIIDNRKAFIKEDFLFGPREFLVLTSSIDKTLENYPQGKNMLEMSALPSYPDKEGTVIVLNEANKQIDRFDYSDKFHSPILDKKDGVSLERIAYDGPTQDAHNWTSAASTHSFATPGSYNSQSRRMGEIEGEIKVAPKVIAPDGNGLDDYTTIQYSFRNQNYVANVYVFDAEGRIVNKIAEQTTLGSQGFFTWTGVDDYQRKVKVGVYMIYLQVFNLNGEVKIFKEPIVIGKKL